MKYLMTIVMAAFCVFQCAADARQKDTVYIYNSWEQMLYREPSMVLLNPEIVAYSPFSVSIWTDDEEVLQKVSEEGHIAISIGDSIWLANAIYLKQEFSGDVKSFEGYVPLFFTEKVAFLTYPAGTSIKDILFGGEGYVDTDNIAYFNIDFEKRTINKVTHKFMSELLNDYRDLQMRYEGMKDYKKNEIIEYFYYKYIDRVDTDDSKPYILDIEGSEYLIQ